MREALAQKDHLVESKIYFGLAATGAVVGLVLFSFLILRVEYLQTVQYSVSVARSEKNRVQVVARPPVRGLILDRQGVLLADNRPSRNLEVIPEQIVNMEDTLFHLATVLEMSEEETARFRRISGRTTRRFESAPVLFDLSDEQVARFEANRFRFPGLSV